MAKNIPIPNFKLQATDFEKDFVWGVSTAAYQIEGAHDIAAKGESIWDRFVTQKGKIYQGHHGRTACDFFNKYKQDILLLKAMHISNFRFSIAWTRILPNIEGIPNEEGIVFYNKVIDLCLDCGITPWVTLYHWDLPQELENQGGWSNRAILNWFETYVSLCASRFGDRVKHWLILNEPMVFTGAGYFLGVHAPGHKGLKKFLPAVHHAILCQALGGRIVRSLVPQAVIGTTFSCSQITPQTDSLKNRKAAEKADALLNRLFIEPSLGMGYPTKSVPFLKKIEKYQHPEDEKNSIFEFDFIGIQNYTREVVKHSYRVPYLQAKIVPATKRGIKTTLMGWEIQPTSIYAMIEKFNGYKNLKKIIITENGAAFKDVFKNGEVHDPERLEYFQRYIEQVYRAKSNGLKVDGYFAWTFTDNFEWAEGYYPRFGLVYIDFNTQERIIKSSGKWYREFLKKTVY